MCLSYDNRDLKLHNLLYVPQIEKNLVPINKLCENNVVSMEFFPNIFYMKNLKTRITILVRETKEGLYHLPSPRGRHVTQVVSCNKAVVSSTFLLSIRSSSL